MTQDEYDKTKPISDLFEDEHEGVFNYNIPETNKTPSFIEVTKEQYNAVSRGILINTDSFIDQHSPGAKLDSSKPMLDLVLGDFAKALQEVGKVGTMGAQKYSEHGWLSVDRGETRYLSAGLRHYFFYREGEEIDPESNLPHLAHAAWNALAALELYLRNNK
jgi:hypothetical protein